MKKYLVFTLLLMFCGLNAFAQKKASIKFETLTHDFGTFDSSKTPKQEYTFVFTNVGDAPLVVNQAVSSCGCTVPSYTKTPIAPGEKGEIKVTYNPGKTLGRFTKNITVRTNGDPELTRLYIKGEITKSGE